MRSLWRILALQWLGGEGSEALTGDSTVLESLMFGEHARMDLVRLAIPRRAYTQSHIEYVVEVILDVWRKREQIRGYEITEQAKFLRHFSAKLRPISN